MEFCGYQSKEAILRLKNADELQKMFKLAKDMADVITDEEKKKVFGIFASKPEKVKMLPGLEITFKQFLWSFEGNKSSVESSGSSLKGDKERIGKQ